MLKFNVFKRNQYRGFLKITSDEHIKFDDLITDYEQALRQHGIYTSYNSSGAPVITSSYLDFYSTYIETKDFPLTIDKTDLKAFKDEFEKVFNVALEIHKNRKEAEKREAALKQSEEEKVQDYIDGLNDFLNK